MEAEREAARKEREIDDLTKDQRTIFISQLTKKVTERDLERFFGQIGKVRSVIMIRDKHSGVHKGFGYVEMADLDTIPNCLLFHNVVPDFQKFPILVKASEAEKNFLAKRDPFNLKNAADPENDPETRVYIGMVMGYGYGYGYRTVYGMGLVMGICENCLRIFMWLSN